MGDRDDWAVLLDPVWEPRFDGEQPPTEALVGGWPLDEHGNPGRFEPNPEYVPATASSPTDPADAVMRLVMEGTAPGDALLPIVRDAMLALAVSEDGYPLVGPAPDGVPCVAVVTAPAHRTRVETDHWAEVTAEQLLDVLPPDTDILLNPDGPASTRLLAGALRASYTEPD
ncbi:type VII secretion system-associated protein [Amycolatopsis sp. GM8]|uniref:type VII secretion system-associated protein n=1 Tax=Amycolatopsis sp. GM8 TaxID=2896530 RepID=UPI001F488CD5|nr:type VII secretion system-associated protein [Amycolatopsis sp. GM8]